MKPMAMCSTLLLSGRRLSLLLPLLLLLLGRTWAYARLSDASLGALGAPGNSFDPSRGDLLAPLLIPRVPGTAGSRQAQQHMVRFFSAQLPGWTVSWQNSSQHTPISGTDSVPFANIIARRDPPGVPPGNIAYMTLAAHYDSLVQPEGFIGAIDSAAPCAMLLHVARAVEPALARKWAAATAGATSADDRDPHGLQILLLDGEEAWVHWTASDSLYGSRALASQWSGEFHAASSTFRTPLDAISLFLLLDLLGSPDPNVPSYFRTTHWAYKHAAELERRLRNDLALLESRPRKPFFPDGAVSSHALTHAAGGGIADDHLPFLSRGVHVLHLIPSPFPIDIWHTMNDDGAHLDLPTVRDWARIVTAFVAEWMELDHFVGPQPPVSTLLQPRSLNFEPDLQLLVPFFFCFFLLFCYS